MKKYLTLSLLTAVLVIPLTTQAQVIKIENPLGAESFEDLLYRVINFIFVLALGIAPIMIIVAGFYFITATGEPEKIQTAKKIILWTLIGLLIVICAKGLITLFKQIFGIG